MYVVKPRSTFICQALKTDYGSRSWFYHIHWLEKVHRRGASILNTSNNSARLRYVPNRLASCSPGCHHPIPNSPGIIWTQKPSSQHPQTQQLSHHSSRAAQLACVNNRPKIGCVCSLCEAKIAKNVTPTQLQTAHNNGTVNDLSKDVLIQHRG